MADCFRFRCFRIPHSAFRNSPSLNPQLRRWTDSDKASSYKNRYGGIITLLALPFTVTVQPAGGDPRTVTVLLPDTRQRYLLAVPRGPIVAPETKVECVNGSMVTRDMKRPSVAYGILGIPKAILSALVPIPGSVRAAEITRIQNQNTLIKERAELENLQNPSPSPTE